MFVKDGNHMFNLDHVTDIFIDHYAIDESRYCLKAFISESESIDFGIYKSSENAEVAMNNLFSAMYANMNAWEVMSDDAATQKLLNDF